MKYINKNYANIKFPEIRLINILDYFRTEPIIVQGVFKFGLKAIGTALYNHKLIKTTWNEKLWKKHWTQRKSLWGKHDES